MGNESAIAVSVVYSPTPRQVHEVKLQLAPQSTILQAIECSGLLQLFAEMDLQAAVVGVWGRRVSLKHRLRHMDRIEIYRPLTVDPKVARRTRFAKQGSRTTGLFAKKRAGAKPGY